MKLAMKIFGGVSLLALVMGTHELTSDAGENKKEAELVDSNKSFTQHEYDLSKYASPFPTDITTPLTHQEVMDKLDEMEEEHLAKERHEREQALLANKKAMEKAEAERVAKEKAEQEAIAVAQAEKEKAKQDKANTEVAKAEEKVEVKSESNNVVSTSSSSESSSQVASSRLLAQLVESEAKGEPYEGKVAVAEVVLNRVASSNFPNSIEGVVYQSGQFQVVSNGSINNAPTASSIQASNQALNGSNTAQGALFFYNSQIATDRWQDSLRTVTVIGRHTFKTNQ